jgi:hypothetical protein
MRWDLFANCARSYGSPRQRANRCVGGSWDKAKGQGVRADDWDEIATTQCAALAHYTSSGTAVPEGLILMCGDLLPGTIAFNPLWRQSP